jgi:hypothetical protein
MIFGKLAVLFLGLMLYAVYLTDDPDEDRTPWD